jgi:hypothetical protein
MIIATLFVELLIVEEANLSLCEMCFDWICILSAVNILQDVIIVLRPYSSLILCFVACE